MAGRGSRGERWLGRGRESRFGLEWREWWSWERLGGRAQPWLMRAIGGDVEERLGMATT